MVEVKTQRLYTIPLQAAWKVPYKQRAKKAVSIIQKFVQRHMKADEKNVKVGTVLNDAVWSRGIKYPPRKVKVQVLSHERDEKGKKITDMWVELEGVKLELEKKKIEAPKKKIESKEAPKAEVMAQSAKPFSSEAGKASSEARGPEQSSKEKKDAHKHEEKKAASEKKD